MPLGTGAKDAQGIYKYGEDDARPLFSDTLNLLADSVSDRFKLVDAAFDAVSPPVLFADRGSGTRTGNNTWQDYGWDAITIAGDGIDMTPGATFATIRRAGYYTVIMGVSITSSDELALNVTVNGSSIPRAFAGNKVAPPTWTATRCVALLKLNAGDKVGFQWRTAGTDYPGQCGLSLKWERPL